MLSRTLSIGLRRSISLIVLVSLILSGLTLPLQSTSTAKAEGIHRSDAVVLINSSSAGYSDFVHYIQPYLDHFGIPYTLLEISSTPIPADIGDYALIVAGHRQLDATDAFLDSAEETAIVNAVSLGTGLVNFDNALFATGGAPLYQFVDEVFTFGYGGSTSGSGVSFPAGIAHYITVKHPESSSIGAGNMRLPGATLPGDVTAIAATGNQAFLAVTTHGAGRAVQWGSYDWMSNDVLGPMYGLDDLVWRSLVWAARKPFVMQGMPPFVTMRVDDESGNFEWIHIANEFGIKPWAGLFYRNIDEVEAADLSALTHAGLATAAIHAYNGSFFYFNHGSGDYSDATVAANFADGTAWHLSHNIPIADFILPHYYEFGANVFAGLSNWGVEFVGTQQDPGQGYGAPWIMNGPFRRYETGGSGDGRPQYYGDYMTIPGHPEFNNQFFNCVTEIRDDAGYEWYPNLSDVAGTIGRGTRQTVRALDAMALATLFTHGYYVGGAWGPSAPANWRAILQGVTANIEPYDPIYVTIDEACRYIRATHNSNITSATYDPITRQVTTNLGMVGPMTGTDIETMFYVFMDGEGQILVDVPAFDGSTTIPYTIPGPLDHVTVSPNPANVVAGTSWQFSATGYDIDNNPIPNLTFDWSVMNGGGAINASGLFTASVTPGTYTHTVVATRNGISGAATVTVTEPIIDHFEIAPIGSPKYINTPFSITIYARDAANHLVPGYTGSVQLSDSTGTLAPSVTGSFTGGMWSGPVTLGAAASGVTITAVNGAITGASNAFDVQTAPTCPCSIWDESATPANTHNVDPNALEIGEKFRSAADGQITHLRVYRGATNLTSPFTGHLWTESGTLLAEVTIPAAASPGWQQVALAEPVAIAADNIYVVSYYSTSGYAVSRPYFTPANQAAYERPPLRALVDGESGGNGVYAYGAIGVFPTNTYESTNYWIDVVFETSAGSDTIPPTIAALSPNDYQMGVAIETDVTVVFSEGMNPATISSATFELRDASNALVPAAVSYDAATRTAKLDPNTSLAFSSPYNALIKGGAGGVADSAGNPLASDRPWSFTTTQAPLPADHFEITAITSPQITGVDFPVVVTARDTTGALASSYAGTATLSASGGAISPSQTEAFVNGSWSGLVRIASPVAISGLTISAADGSISGQSDAFDLHLPPPAPPFYTVTSPSYEQPVGHPFEVTVTAFPGATINLWEDNHQEPVLATTTDPTPLNPPGETDGQWTEFLYAIGRPYPSILAAVNEENYGLPMMRFYTSGIPNGQYEVIANLYDNAPMRYYFGYTPDNPKAHYVDTPGGAVGAQHNEYSLGVVTLTGGDFSLYVQDADLRPGANTYPFFGWAWIRLAPINSDTVINLWEDNHQDPILVTTSDLTPLMPAGEVDGLWTEFLYPSVRPYPTILAAVNEENYGLPVMRFYSSGVPDGEYEVFANLYDNAPMRYYFGYTPEAPKAIYIDTPGGAPGTQHREYRLGTVTVSDGVFNLYVVDADLLPGGATYPFFGWAWIRLSPQGVTMSSSSATMQFDGDGDGAFGEPGDNVKSLVDNTFVISSQDTAPGSGILITASDALGRTGSNTYTIQSSNVPPVLADLVDQSTPELVELTFTATATDPDSPTGELTFSLVGAPAGASIVAATGVFTWTPSEAQGPGEYTVDVCVSDGSLSDCDTIILSVTEVNLPPVAENLTLTTMEDIPVAIALSATDADGNALSYIIVSGPAHGALSGTAPNLTYTPNLDYSGPDSFTYKVHDGLVDSNTATVTLSITPVNDPPTAVDDTFAATEDTTLTAPAPGVLGNDTDVDSTSEGYTWTDSFADGSKIGATDQTIQITDVSGEFGVDFTPYAGNPLRTLESSDPWNANGDVLKQIPGAVHSDVIYFPDGMDGYKFWKIFTPGPENGSVPPGGYGSPDFWWERNTLVRSNDGINWVKTPDYSNPLTAVGNPGEWDDGWHADPDFVYAPGEGPNGESWFLYYTGCGSGGCHIALAMSQDGKHYTKYGTGPVNPAFRCPTVIYNQATGIFQMWYNWGSFDVGYATSTDGINWNPYNPVNPDQWGYLVYQGHPGTYDAGGVTHMDVINFNGLYHMYYLALPTGAYANLHIGHATSPDGIAWTQVATPALTPGNEIWSFWNGPTTTVQSFYRPTVAKVGDMLYLYYGGVDGATAYPANNYDIGLAFSTMEEPDGHVELDTAFAPAEYAPAEDTVGWYHLNEGASSSTYPGEYEPVDQTMAWYHLNEGSGATTGDSGGANNDTGTLNNPAWTTGVYGSGLAFDGNDRVEIPYSADFTAQNGFSVEAWVKPAVYKPNNYIAIQMTNGGSDYTFGFKVESTYTPGSSELGGFIVNPAGQMYFAYGGTIPLNQWSHAAITWQPGDTQVRLYINGSEVTYRIFDAIPAGTQLLQNTSPFFLGVIPITSPQYFNGVMDEVRFMARPLTPAEIAADGTIEGPPLALDSSGNNRHGASIGSLSYVPGQFGNAVDFNAAGYIHIPYDTGLDIADELTLESWVNLDNLRDNSFFISKTSAEVYPPTHSSFGFKIDAAGLEGWIWHTEPGYTGEQPYFKSETSQIPATGAWTFVTMTYKASEKKVRLYMNGQEVAYLLQNTVAGNGLIDTPANLPLVLGQYNTGPAWFSYPPIDGRMDEVRILDRALTAEEVLADYGRSRYSSGYLTSTLITPPAGQTWSSFQATDTRPAGTDIVYSIMNASGAVLLTPVVDGQDISTLGSQPIRLKAEMSTSSRAATPLIQAWSVTTSTTTLTAALVDTPTHGTLSFNADGSFTYTPNANFNGTDAFTYRANDGQADSNLATVTIHVASVNDAPVALDDAYSTGEDTTLTIPASGLLSNDSDIDSAVLTSVLVAGPAHGTLALDADGAFTYTPEVDWSGADSFTYKANDGELDSNTAMVTITVGLGNDPPVAANDSYSTDEDILLTIAAPGLLGNDSDVEGQSLTSVLVAGPAHGTLTLAADGAFTYTPETNWSGADSFTYKANDGELDSNTATVTITVNPVNDPPVAVDDSYSTNEGILLTITAPGVLGNDSDVEGQSLTSALVTGPAHGTLALDADGAFTYTPAANWSGTDSFTYKANDGELDSNTATVTITVNPVNNPPVAVDDSYTTSEDVPLTIAVPGILGNDTDTEHQSLTAVLVVEPAHGTLALDADGAFTYTPATNWSGTDSFTYRANDGERDSNTATVTITVNPVNDPPVAVADSYSTNEGTPLNISAPGVLANDSDIDSSTLTAALAAGATHGALVLNANGSFTYTPAAGYSGSDSFTYQASDGELTSNTATVHLTVLPVAEPTCVIYQRGLYGTVEDSYIWAALPNNNYATSSTLYTGLRNHATFGPKETRLLLRFDLSDLPAGAAIQSATLGLTGFNSPAGEQIGIFPMTAAWGEAANPRWNTLANAFDPASAGSFTTASGSVSADVTALVQAWTGNSRPNYGMMLIDADVDAGNLYRASEYASTALRPRLEVCYRESFGQPVAIEVTPENAAIPAGASQAYQVTARDAGGNTWDVTAESTFTIDIPAGGAWSANTYTSQNQGSWTVIAAFSGLTDATGLTVAEHGDANSLGISPASTTLNAGQSVTYTVTAGDAFGNTWDATAESSFSIPLEAGGSWSGNTYTSQKAGVWTVSAGYAGLSATALLSVLPADAATLNLTPDFASISSGAPVAYHANATDAFGNTWDASAAAVFSIDPAAGGAWVANTYTSAALGTWTVTAAYTGRSDTATLVVTPATEPTCVTYQRGLSGVVQDSFVWEALPNNSYTASTTLYTGLRSHVTQGLRETRLLLHFDLDDLPAGASIQSATLGLTMFNSPAGQQIAIHPMTAAWSEATSARWNTLATAFDPASVASFTTATGRVTADLTALVQTWLNGSQNYGVMLINTGGAGNLYRSSEFSQLAQRPSLQVCYLGGTNDGTSSGPNRR